MSFLLHVNILDAFIGSNNCKHIFTFCTLKKRLRIPLIINVVIHSLNDSFRNFDKKMISRK